MKISRIESLVEDMSLDEIRGRLRAIGARVYDYRPPPALRENGLVAWLAPGDYEGFCVTAELAVAWDRATSCPEGGACAHPDGVRDCAGYQPGSAGCAYDR